MGTGGDTQGQDGKVGLVASLPPYLSSYIDTFVPPWPVVLYSLFQDNQIGLLCLPLGKTVQEQASQKEKKHKLHIIMLLSAILLYLGLLAGVASAGSRLWEAKLASEFEGPGNNLTRRAIAFRPAEGSGGVRRWPDKTIKYCFEDDNASTRLKGMFLAGQERWSLLAEHGFQYREVSRSECRSNRINVLLIKYNDKGHLGSTIGVPAIDADYNRRFPDRAILGPTMHLSDVESVGFRDLPANAAHEIGHAWGLLHEHQNPNFWKTSPEHMFNPETFWPIMCGNTFHTNRFNCENLKDYETKMAEVLADPNKGFNDEDQLCSSQKIAAKYRFSASEWLPLPIGTPFDADREVDLTSIMLYPSGAGGKGTADSETDNRLPVLTLAGGEYIPHNLAPSGMDLARLLLLYGSETRGQSELHGTKGGKKSNLFSRIRKKIGRGGDTKDGVC